MIIVITPEKALDNEPETVNELLKEGLNLLHIRKPFSSREEVRCFISKIHSEFHHRLVLHNHYDLAEEFNLSRFHFRESDRQNIDYKNFKGKIISTSVHDIETFNKLEKDWNYAFISPVFTSISKKGYGKKSTILNDIKKRENFKTKLIALGGIDDNNIRNAWTDNVDGAALLGAIWESKEPINVFRKCIQNVHSS